VGDPAGSNATAGLALRVTGTHKPLHHAKVDIYGYNNYNKNSNKWTFTYKSTCFDLRGSSSALPITQ